MNKNRTSKFIALILRHKPEVIGISLDEHGWAEVDALVAGIAERQPFTREMLEDIVQTDIFRIIEPIVVRQILHVTLLEDDQLFDHAVFYDLTPVVVRVHVCNETGQTIGEE